MGDKFTTAERSVIMRAVKGQDTSLEKRVRSVLWKAGLRYRKNVSKIPGKPDIVFTRKKLLVFIDSCFWHGCPQHLRAPKSNESYWKRKISRNRERDAFVTLTCSGMGWNVLRIWEHQLKEDFDSCIRTIEKNLR